MASAVERFVASVTIILGTLPARRVERKFVFPVGRENTVQNVSVNLDLIVSNSFVVYYFITIENKSQEL